MNRKTTAAITTAAVGVAMGTAAYMMTTNGKSSQKRVRKIKKTAGAAIRQVGDFIDNVSYMMK